jgi:hypothetical protein
MIMGRPASTPPLCNEHLELMCIIHRLQDLCRPVNPANIQLVLLDHPDWSLKPEAVALRLAEVDLTQRVTE